MPLALHADLVNPLRNAARRTHKRKSLRWCQKIRQASRRHEVVTEHWPFDSHGERVPWSTANIC